MSWRPRAAAGGGRCTIARAGTRRHAGQMGKRSVKERITGVPRPPKPSKQLPPPPIVRVEDGRDIRDVSCWEAFTHDIMDLPSRCGDWVIIVPFTLSAPFLVYTFARMVTEDPRFVMGSVVCACASNFAPIVYYMLHQPPGKRTT